MILTLILMKAKCKLSSVRLEQLELPIFINLKHCRVTRYILGKVRKVNRLMSILTGQC
jgi:hypothetical protein